MTRAAAPQDIFRADLKRMVDNCRAYNPAESVCPNHQQSRSARRAELSRSLNRLQVYYDCANLLETFFTARIDTLPLPV